MTIPRAALLLLSCSLCFAGCASLPRDPAARAEFKARHDPLEPLNRRTFAFNLFLDRTLIKPAAKGYRRLIPQKGRDALRHFLDNLSEPVVLANDLLQGRLKSAAVSGGRFVVNSTAGVAGFSDVASRHRLPKQTGDFGQTLSVWGFGEGPYLILPVFGPSNPRDLVGSGVDIYADPFRYVARRQNYPTGVSVSRTAVDGIDKRARNIEIIDEMQREAVDYYASFRSLFRQNRAAELNVGKPAAPVLLPDFYDDPAQ
jgi:phospholipid-binding lipoprotein MlaA